MNQHISGRKMTKCDTNDQTIEITITPRSKYAFYTVGWAVIIGLITIIVTPRYQVNVEIFPSNCRAFYTFVSK